MIDLDYIESELEKALLLLKQAEEAASKMQWISVEDRLPPESYDEYVLAYGCGRFCGARKRRAHVEFCRYIEKEGGFLFGEYDCPLTATHWMPLPNPPEES